MIGHFTVILGFQLLGEILVRSLGAPIPGPVLGMILFLGLLVLRPSFADSVKSTAQGLLTHLSLLFVPAGVGVVGHINTLGSDVGVILLTIIASTILAIVVGAYAFTWTAKLIGQTDE
jgi:putative effector of murein hydrolase LrgA (UPF0299 family)